MERRRLLFVHTTRGIKDRTAESAFSHISGYEVKPVGMRELTDGEIAEADAIFVITNYQKRILQRTKGVAKQKIVVLGIQREHYNIERAKTLEWEMNWERALHSDQSWLWDDADHTRAAKSTTCGCGGKTLCIRGEVVCQNCGASWNVKEFEPREGGRLNESY